MADREKKSVRLEVSKETHDEWTSFVKESSEYSTLSGLIRSAVTREMLEADRDSGPVNVNLEPVQIAIQDLEKRVGGVEEEMRSLDLATNAVNDERVRDMMHHVRELIPLVESEDDLHDVRAVVELPPDERAKLSGTIKDVADALREEASRAAESDEDTDSYEGRVDVWDVERALERLSREVERVKVTVEDGERRYYEVEP